MAKKRNSNDLSSPRSRTERYLAKIAGLNDSMPPSPFSRLERYLEAIALRSAGVGSFNGRTGAVVPESGDYTAGMVGALSIYGKGKNLLDNSNFTDVNSIIDQRGGYVLVPNATYYTDTALSENPVTVNAYTTAYYPDVHSSYVGFYLTDDPAGTEYYASLDDCVRGYTGSGYNIDRWGSTSSNVEFGVLIRNTLVLDTISIGASEAGVLWQKVAPYIVKHLLGKTVTLTALIDGNLISVSGSMPNHIPESNTGVLISDVVNNIRLQLRFYTTGELRVRFLVSGVGTVSIGGAFLEEGNIQTAFVNVGTEENPLWVPSSTPDMDWELYKAQSYQIPIDLFTTAYPVANGAVVIGEQWQARFYIPCHLRGNATSNLDKFLSQLRIYTVAGRKTPTAVDTVHQLFDNRLTIRMQLGENLNPDTPASFAIVTNRKYRIILSANL